MVNEILQALQKRAMRHWLVLHKHRSTRSSRCDAGVQDRQGALGRCRCGHQQACPGMGCGRQPA